MNVSATQLNTTGSNEGFVATAYKDGFIGGVQQYSIGYGHQIKSNEGGLRTATLTKAQALAYLKADMQTVVNYINAYSKKTLNQNQFDALADFGFNCGTGALGKVLDTLNTKGYDAVPAHINQYVKSGNPATTNPTLVKRRAQNVATWNGAVKYAVIGIIAVLLSLAYCYYQLENNKSIPFEEEIAMFV